MHEPSSAAHESCSFLQDYDEEYESTSSLDDQFLQDGANTSRDVNEVREGISDAVRPERIWHEVRERVADAANASRNVS